GHQLQDLLQKLGGDGGRARPRLAGGGPQPLDRLQVAGGGAPDHVLGDLLRRQPRLDQCVGGGQVEGVPDGLWYPVVEGLPDEVVTEREEAGVAVEDAALGGGRQVGHQGGGGPVEQGRQGRH